MRLADICTRGSVGSLRETSNNMLGLLTDASLHCVECAARLQVYRRAVLLSSVLSQVAFFAVILPFFSLLSFIFSSLSCSLNLTVLAESDSLLR